MIVLKKNLTAKTSVIKRFLQPRYVLILEKIPETGSNYISWLVKLIDYVFKKDENYYPQAFLKECKCIEKYEKVIR